MEMKRDSCVDCAHAPSAFDLAGFFGLLCAAANDSAETSTRYRKRHNSVHPSPSRDIRSGLIRSAQNKQKARLYHVFEVLFLDTSALTDLPFETETNQTIVLEKVLNLLIEDSFLFYSLNFLEEAKLAFVRNKQGREIAAEISLSIKHGRGGFLALCAIYTHHWEHRWRCLTRRVVEPARRCECVVGSVFRLQNVRLLCQRKLLVPFLRV